MRLATKSAPTLALVMLSACGQPEPPRTVSDFCLVDKRISVDPAPMKGMDDPGNQYDSEPTFLEVLEHNEVHDRLCANQ